MSWDWLKDNEMNVAKFATDDALKLFDLNVSAFDLRRENKIEDLLKAIYDTLVLQQIKYEEPKPNSSEAYQSIRTPVEVLKQPKNGTCIDLALLFCGLCLGCGLLPKIVMLVGHSLVVVPIVKELLREDYRSNDSFQKKFLGRRDQQRNFLKNEKGEFIKDAKGNFMIDTQGNSPIIHEPYKDIDDLIDSIAGNRCLAIECTGFAYSKSMISGSTELPLEFKRDEKGYLTFEQATKVGRMQFDRIPFLYAVDIEVAHKEWGIAPETFEIPGGWEKAPMKEVIEQRITQASGDRAIAVGENVQNSTFITGDSNTVQRG